ncbi:hypothetical protein LPJ64_002627 [Coemansia asiatica]|uniref:Helicase C-terminal domain-containing protein n=1 Tax=Coemansia asiatica TaxID=1052880 RepID=A0A9W8CIX7_9FUNG|nr:hypothetical protein LPJ64_002627 [Coemansia asiatica]
MESHGDADQHDGYCNSNSNSSRHPSLLDIFQFLESPNPSPFVDICSTSQYADIFQACTSASKYDGMRTSLYQYQKNSLFKMLRRELLPDFFLDPLLNALFEDKSVEKKRFTHPLQPYFQFKHGFDRATNRWILESQINPGKRIRACDASWYSDSPGGIICEDMGTGKTCECLALILLTKRQMARPPVEGDLLPCVGTVASTLKTDYCSRDKGLPRLKDLAIIKALLSCAESLRIMFDEGMVPEEIWPHMEPYPPYYWVNPITESRTRRGTASDTATSVAFKVYMSSSTIVVVPDNLIDQWVREKYKHIEDVHGLEMLKIDSSTNTIPEPRALIKHDLVLISVSRLSKEYIPIDSNLGEMWFMCRCYSRGLQVCACGQRSQNATSRSPLLRVHWKRLIVDEGHIMSSRNTTRSMMAAYLIAERRWICTGTPTQNLVHATSALAAEAGDSPPLSPHDNNPDDGRSLSASGWSDRASASRADSPVRSSQQRRSRSAVQRDGTSDFYQLGTLVSKFLRIDPFAHSASAWHSLIVQPYKRDDPGARDRLRALLQNIMVRNRPETISTEVSLPPLYEKSVELQPTAQQALTYNTVVAFFHINAILTERAGRDYFFHPENKRHLRQIVQNLFGACFWFSISLKHITEGISNGQIALELWEIGKKPYAAEDVELLRQSISILKQASENSEWRYIAQSESIGYRVAGLPARISKDILNTHSVSSFKNTSAASENNSSCSSATTSQQLITAAQLLQLVNGSRLMLTVFDETLPPRPINIDPQEFDHLQKSAATHCSSNKIAYILNQIQRFQPTEKCIVFVNNRSEITLLHDALRIARIPHLVYASQGMSQSQRRNNIMTFSSSTMYNTIVMDIQLAAYGIDLSAASRVWFVSPTWQAARERQAIKRAHRLGQSKPVFVETLLTKGTVEEALWRRRQELSESEQDAVVAKDVEEDGKMRGILSNSSFVAFKPDQAADAGVFSPAIRLWPSNLRYPSSLREMYFFWSPNSPENASSSVPFFKTRKLVLRFSDHTSLNFAESSVK